MDIFSTVIMLGFFSFLYYLGFTEEDTPLEFCGCIGFLILGIITFATQISLVSITAGQGCVDSCINYVVIPASNSVGLLLVLFSFLLTFYSYRSYTEKKSLIETGG